MSNIKFADAYIVWPNIQPQDWLIKLPNDNNKVLRYRERQCYGTLSADQTIPDSTNTILLFDTFYTNDYRMAQQPSVPDWRETVKFPGSYLITRNVSFEANATGIRQVTLLINWAVTIPNPNTNQIQVIKWFTGWPFSINTITWSIEVNLQYNDYIQLEVYQDSGWPLDVDKIATSFRIYGT